MCCLLAVSSTEVKIDRAVDHYCIVSQHHPICCPPIGDCSSPTLLPQQSLPRIDVPMLCMGERGHHAALELTSTSHKRKAQLLSVQLEWGCCMRQHHAADCAPREAHRPDQIPAMMGELMHKTAVPATDMQCMLEVRTGASTAASGSAAPAAAAAADVSSQKHNSAASIRATSMTHIRVKQQQQTGTTVYNRGGHTQTAATQKQHMGTHG